MIFYRRIITAGDIPQRSDSRLVFRQVDIFNFGVFKWTMFVEIHGSIFVRV